MVLADVTMTPDPANLPGGEVLQHLTNGLGGWALIGALVALLIGAAAWALGSHAQNIQQSLTGRKRPCSWPVSPHSSSGRRRPSSTSSSMPGRACTDMPFTGPMGAPVGASLGGP